MVALPGFPSIVGRGFPDAPRVLRCLWGATTSARQTTPQSWGRGGYNPPLRPAAVGNSLKRHALGNIVLQLIDGNLHLRPAKTRFRRGPLADFTSSAGVNPACGKVPAHAGTLVRR